MLAPRSVLATVLSFLGCAAFVLGAGPAAASSPPFAGSGAHARVSGRERHVRATCARNSARRSFRARIAERKCRGGTPIASSRGPARTPRAPRSRRDRPRSLPNPVPSAEVPPVQSPTATVASVTPASCQNTELTPETENLPLIRAAVLCLINRTRAENGEAPLLTNPELEQAAEGHCQEIVADDYFAHVSPSGETPVQRVAATGYIPSANDGYVIGENLAWGTYGLSTPQQIVAAWIASPGHLANILEARYRETGIGVTPSVPASLGNGAPGATYAQEFGVIEE